MAALGFSSLLLLAVIIYGCHSHPQCLDFQPPFVPNAKRMWCRRYSKLGCCTAKQDAILKSRYDSALKIVRVKKQHKCKRYLFKVVCLECHSWSAHIFDAETNPYYSANSALPCLGYKFCQRLVKYCGPAIEQLYGQAMSNRNITLRDFCREAEVTLNRDLCYPKIRKTLKRMKMQKQRNVVYWNATKKGCLCVREVVRDLRNPLAIVHANDGTHRLFIVEQIGLIHILTANGTKLQQPFMDIRKNVFTRPNFGDERGLLGLAFHPKYCDNGRLFVYYNLRNPLNKKWPTRGGRTVLSEWKVSAKDMNKVDPNSEKIRFIFEQPMSNHNGGQLLFVNDSYLYIFLGDGGGAGDPFGTYGNALNMSSLLGKVLRIDVDVAMPGIPPDNPFINVSGARPEIYAYGLRNPWRCSVDRGDRKNGYGKGRIFCGDVGQNAFEEIDIIVKGGNYGWRGREGFNCYDKLICNSKLMAGETLPIHAYSHKVGQSVVGGYVYRGCKYPNMRGSYFFADTMNGRIFTLKENQMTKKWHSKEVCFGNHLYCNGPKVSGFYAPMILTFGEDELGELYFASTLFSGNESPQGVVYQLFDPQRRNDPSNCKLEIVKPPRSGCYDRMCSKFCLRYKHYCTRFYVEYMKKRCRLTCGFC